MPDLQPDRIALQRQKRFWGTLTVAEYDLMIAALERATRRRMPARAFLEATAWLAMGSARGLMIA